MAYGVEMKILHVVDQISQETGGGSARAAFELAEAQAKYGHDVTIYTTDYNAAGQKPPHNVRLVKFHTVAFLFNCMPVAPGLLTARYDFDIMHLHNYRTIVNLFAVCGPRPPFVLQAHGSCWPIVGRTKPLHDLVWGRMMLRRAKRCIADADREIGQYVKEAVPAMVTSLIPVGINLSDYKKLPARENNGKKTVLFLGRLHEIKGPDLLVNAFKLINDPDVVLQITGPDYGYEAEARRLASGMNGRVKFTGPLYGTDKVRAMVQADVFVMPSRYEMWGIAFMEALACGAPVIMTDNCEAAKILPAECGVSVPFDEDELATAISTMLENGFTEKHRTYRRKWVAQFDWQKIARRTIGLYAEVINGQS